MSISAPDEYGCQVWLGALNERGYGQDGKRLAHVVLWERTRGAVPDGMYLDHRCRNRACCRLEHLHVVSKSENERMKSWGVRCRRPLCDAGHPNDAFHAIVTGVNAGRVCRVCAPPKG